MSEDKLRKYYNSLMDDDIPFRMEVIDRKAVSKERARSPHHYTPKRTRDFEKLIKEWGSTVNRKPFTCPVEAHIIIIEPIPKSYTGKKLLAAQMNLIAPPVGDLDNKIKAIEDGLSGIAYLNDKQVKRIYAERRYGDRHIITIIITRAGLSNQELVGFELEHSGGSAKVG